MTRFVNLLVVGAVLGSAADAGERSLLPKLRLPFLQKTSAVDEPVPTPVADPLLTPLPSQGEFVDPSQPYVPAPSGPTFGPYGGEPVPSPAPHTPHYGGPGFGGPSYGAPAPSYAPPVTPGYPVSAPSPRVKIEDPENIHPHAVRTVIMVPPPCKCRLCAGCELVPVEICVPPCVCEKHKVRRNGHYQELDFGKYEVEIRVKDTYVEVDYDD